MSGIPSKPLEIQGEPISYDKNKITWTAPTTLNGATPNQYKVSIGFWDQVNQQSTKTETYNVDKSVTSFIINKSIA